MNERASKWVAFVLLVAALVPACGAYGAGGTTPIVVTVDRAEIPTQLGGRFAFQSTITNRGTTASDGLIAHLNVLSLRDGVYVDPEDWSSQRTRFLDAIPAGGSTTITWDMQAVNAGSFGVYVAVVPRLPAVRPPTTGLAVHIAVAERRTLNPGGILPLVLTVPTLLALLTLGLGFRRRTIA